MSRIFALAAIASLIISASTTATSQTASEPAQQFKSARFDGNVEVKGSIVAQSLKLTPKTADFVFGPGYELRALPDVESFIQQNGHLPEIPSADEMVKNGVAVETLNGLYLQKIEELTLYLIKQDRELASLRAQVSRLER